MTQWRFLLSTIMCYESGFQIEKGIAMNIKVNKKKYEALKVAVAELSLTPDAEYRDAMSRVFDRAVDFVEFTKPELKRLNASAKKLGLEF
jgi:hypothetical protein